MVEYDFLLHIDWGATILLNPSRFSLAAGAYTPLIAQFIMDTRGCCDNNELGFSCDCPLKFVYSLPLPEKKSALEEDFKSFYTPEELRHLELKHSKDLQQMVRRSQRLQNRRVVDTDPAATPSPEDLENATSSHDMSLDPSQHSDSRVLDPAAGMFAGDSSTSQATLVPNLDIPIITFGVDKQPPAEVRTSSPLPAIIVSLKRIRVRSDGSRLALENNNLWGQASLVSADGRVAMAPSRADILTGSSLVAPMVLHPLYTGDEDRWTLTFMDLLIMEPGHFKIHIALIGTLQDEDQGHGSPVVNAPAELLSVDTSAFRVHAFAPAVGNTGKQLELPCCIIC